MVIHVASTVAAQSQIAEAQRRKDQGLPPLPEPEIKPPTMKDKLEEAGFWLLVLSPAILIGACVGMALYATFKIAFALQGHSFP